MLRARPLARRLGSAVLLAAALFAAPASATLTDSERGQIRDFYVRGEPANAPRVRALLARPDLTPAEIESVWMEAARQAPFDDAHQRFVTGMLFGPASAPSRSELLAPVVRGLLARAESVVSGGGSDPARLAELMRIHGFVTQDVARATRTGEGSAAAAVRSDVVREVVKAYREHLALPPMAPDRLPAGLRLARLQAELALFELARDVHAPADIAAWVAVSPDAASVLARTGVLVHGLEGAPADKSRSVASLVEAAPQATLGTSVLWVDKPWPRGLLTPDGTVVAHARLAATTPVNARALWSSSVTPSRPDAGLTEIAFVLARAAAARLVAQDEGVRSASGAALTRARSRGSAGFLAVGATLAPFDAVPFDAAATSVSEVDLLAHAGQLVLLDAPRALALAAAHASGGHFEPLEQLLLAIGLVATDQSGAMRRECAVGVTTDAGLVKETTVTNIEGPAGRIERLTLDGKTLTVERDADGRITSATVNGKPLELSTFPMARRPTAAGPTWTHGGATYTTLVGTPEMGFDTNGTVRVRAAEDAAGATSDGVVSLRPAGNELDLNITVLGAAPVGAVLVRAARAKQAGKVRGIAVEFGGTKEAPTATFVTYDDAGLTMPLASPVKLPTAETGHPLVVKLRRNEVTFELAGRSVRSALPAELSAGTRSDLEGEVALLAKAGAELEVRGLVLGAPTGSKSAKDGK